MQTNEEYIITNVEVALPKFEGMQGAEDIWRITAEDMQNYEKVFKHFDKENQGYLTDSDMQSVMKMTKSDKDVCASVWEISNPDGEEYFSKPMFLIAMHLLYKKKKDDSVQLPSEIPQSLLESSGMKGKKPMEAAPTVFVGGKLSGQNSTLEML
jgi:hypothetical protein